MDGSMEGTHLKVKYVEKEKKKLLAHPGWKNDLRPKGVVSRILNIESIYAWLKCFILVFNFENSFSNELSSVFIRV